MIGTLIFYMIIRKALQVSREDDIFYIVRKEHSGERCGVHGSPHRLVPGIRSHRREGGKGRKQKEIACEIAFDALKRTMTPILEEKGYMNFSFSTFKETAHIDVQFNGGVSISINVELLEDFLDETMNVLQSLPQFQKSTEIIYKFDEHIL